ncbi:MAG TPA: phosphate/phosphite/phosphonate ABC transporter substrate-binding protein, partial [Lacipirellulaceae bacterium]|nr:phosphate/phosphite/phosphonate ABC transporter substrate-binding protein [Lacipirellulaceae bacterium]
EPHTSVSVSRVLKIVIPIGIVAIAAYVWSKTWEPTEREKLATNSFTRILASNPLGAAAAMKFADNDGDLVADSPSDPKQCINPDTLVFSYVAAETESVPEDAWKDLLAALKKKTGRDVKYAHYDTVDEQLAAMEKGELHIAGLNTGFVPLAVAQAGFVPLCTFGHDDGSYGYTMQVLVPADSPIKKLADVKGHKITFTRPDSNSGCKALLVLLNDEGLQPDRDYEWGFSTDHSVSIKGIASKLYEVAPVASDILQLMEENGDVDKAAIRKVYESKRFPPATIGYVYNLDPGMRSAIRDTVVGLNLKGTSLEGKMGADATKLVPVNYKKDWDSARAIDKLAADAQAKRAK